MQSKKIRQGFLSYFKTQSHVVVPSSPVVPLNDPTLLFVNAGMNQFKDVFLGKDKREYNRATSSQKCIRVGGKHNDLENVGHTARHLTLFEMLGNFSFGDYFKKEAIGFAFDVATHVFGFDPEKIWATIYQDDEEAFELWQKHVPVKRIVRFGKESNFWAMGDVGPCGPCSELLYDRGVKFSEAKNPIEDVSGERFLEFWNLVFMEFNRSANGEFTPLPKKSIDTGAGLERLVALKMDVDCVFHTDILRGLIAETENISGVKYEYSNKDLAAAFHVIADHIRSLSFAIADGAQPSNTERGYILRKILRRAARHGKKLGLNDPFLARLVPRLVREMGDDFREIRDAESRIQEILTIEEEGFIKTLKRGDNLLTDIIQRSKNIISGDDAFKLKDTYGFPVEEVLLIAKDAHMSVDLERLNVLEEEAKEKSRKVKKAASEEFQKNLFSDFTHTHASTQFVGYDKASSPARIVAIVVGDRFVDHIDEGEEGLIVLDKTPFYAEKGGQVGDRGTISEGENLFEVEDTQLPFSKIVSHVGRVKKGSFKKQGIVTAAIDIGRRKAIERNHTATHLLHFALQEVLGSHVKQAGSLVEDTGLRFDFNHHKALTSEEVRRAEELVNEKIRGDEAVNIYETALDTVQQKSSIKQFFGDKYESQVRVVDIDYSKELCGGTHVKRVGEIGFFKIEREGSIAAGVRRIEAVSGEGAEKMVQKMENEKRELASLLKTEKLKAKAESLIEENRNLALEIKKLKEKERANLKAELFNKKENIGYISLIAKEVDLPPKELALFADELISRSGVVLLATGEVQIIIKVGDDLVKKGLFASDLIKEVVPIINGGGGGKKESAQAGGTAPDKIPEAFNKVREKLKKFLENV